MTKSDNQDIEVLRKRFDELRDRRTTAQANLRHAQETLEKLRAEAREKYKTDDPEALKKLLEKIKAENEQKRSEYQTHLDQIDEKLAALESDNNA